MHAIGVSLSQYHDRTSCQTHAALVHGITASTRTIAVLGPPLFMHAILISVVLLCFSISGLHSRFPRLPPQDLSEVLVSTLQFALRHVFSSHLFHPESLLSADRERTHLLVHSCLTSSLQITLIPSSHPCWSDIHSLYGKALGGLWDDKRLWRRAREAYV